MVKAIHIRHLGELGDTWELTAAGLRFQLVMGQEVSKCLLSQVSLSLQT